MVAGFREKGLYPVWKVKPRMVGSETEHLGRRLQLRPWQRMLTGSDRVDEFKPNFPTVGTCKHGRTWYEHETVAFCESQAWPKISLAW